jgi:hypothetical protein
MPKPRDGALRRRSQHVAYSAAAPHCPAMLGVEDQRSQHVPSSRMGNSAHPQARGRAPSRWGGIPRPAAAAQDAGGRPDAPAGSRSGPERMSARDRYTYTDARATTSCGRSRRAGSRLSAGRRMATRNGSDAQVVAAQAEIDGTTAPDGVLRIVGLGGWVAQVSSAPIKSPTNGCAFKCS